MSVDLADAFLLNMFGLETPLTNIELPPPSRQPSTIR
jgi:hypothetical protein